jgi:hypothetical protein
MGGNSMRKLQRFIQIMIALRNPKGIPETDEEALKNEITKMVKSRADVDELLWNKNALSMFGVDVEDAFMTVAECTLPTDETVNEIIYAAYYLIPDSSAIYANSFIEIMDAANANSEAAKRIKKFFGITGKILVKKFPFTTAVFKDGKKVFEVDEA